MNLSNELIKMPFGKYSEILINGQFVNDFDKLNIGIVDITDIDNTSIKLNFKSADNESVNEGVY